MSAIKKIIKIAAVTWLAKMIANVIVEKIEEREPELNAKSKGRRMKREIARFYNRIMRKSHGRFAWR